MPSENLQTVIVSKDVAKTQAKAERLARKHANRIYTVRQTKRSWRFRQRPPDDFKKKSFRTFPIPGHPGIALVYGELTAAGKRRNPEPPPLHRAAARMEVVETGPKPAKRVYRGWEREGERPERPRKRAASEPPSFHAASAYTFLGRKRKKGKAGNPGKQRHLQWKGTDHDSALRDWDFWLAVQPKIRRARSERELAKLAKAAAERDVKSLTIKMLIYGAIADRARERRWLFAHPSPEVDERYVRSLVSSPNPQRPKTPNKAKKKTKKTSSKKRASKKAPKAIKLKSPKVMPDPGPCAWVGSTLEISFDTNGKLPRWVKKGEKDRDIWDCGRREWMCLWSPKYKAIIAIPKPRGLKGGPGCAPRKGKVVRDGGAAKMFERFAARPAEMTQEVEIGEVPLRKLGKGVHVVYRSDKWSESRKTTDYIHDFKSGVVVYCGPTIEKPEVFLIFGGKLTLTERGFVF